tara:strand:+ start:453 stop:668 length:216 start_codon:yes stop_codon:yes gene_type:complete
MKLPRLSPISGKINTLDLDVTVDQFVAWEKGALIQDAFPNLNMYEREFIISGITKDEWDAKFGDGGEMYDP